VGSYGKFAAFKAEVLNAFVQEMRVDTVIEFGCGDGNQLTLARYPLFERDGAGDAQLPSRSTTP
jgi:hypothetical protein